jgi:hypothetical protein
MFAWVGGLALFLGVAFFVKYSFDRNLISAQMRVAIGYTVGLGLLVGGLWMPRARHVVTVHSLCATGILILYANTFAARSHYNFLDVFSAFAVMSLITLVAFLLAIRLRAQVVAVLGLLGGFLTPVLLSTGVDNPLGLFGYLALLDVGLLAVVLVTRWNYLSLLAAAATALMEFAWVIKFFAEQKVYTAMTVFVGFAALFLAAFLGARRVGRIDRWNSSAAIIPALSGLIFAAYLLGRPFPAVAQRVWLMLGYIIVLDLVFLTVAWAKRELRGLLTAAGAIVFALLMGWTTQYLKPELLEPALVFYLLFAVIHAVAPVVLERRDPSPGSSAPAGWIHVFPSLALILMLVPLFTIAGPSFWIWPVVLAVDLLAIILAIMTASLVSILAVILLTALGTAAWIFQLPTDLPGVPGMLIVVGGFAVFFMGAALFAAGKVFRTPDANAGAAAAGQANPRPMLTREMFTQITALSAVLPFLLLALVVLRLPLANPSAVFGLAVLIVVLMLGVALRGRVDALVLVALGSVLLLEHVWHFRHFTPEGFGLATAWYLGFSAIFFVFPFLFRAALRLRSAPWVASALAWPLHFLILYRAFVEAHPNYAFNGLVPAALAVPCLVGLMILVKWKDAVGPAAALSSGGGEGGEAGEGGDGGLAGRAHLTRLALFGGAALLFITAIFPIQFDRQWITIAWALEGVALFWLYHRVPHPGLRLTGLGLLIACFARLALNPWVISDYGRTGTPIWNWYLYTYGLVAASFMAGARLLSAPRDRVGPLVVPPVLYSLGTILLFLLVNIEIADSFSPPGHYLVFNFSGDFAQDMTYSLAWALFAFAVLGVGFRLRHAATRYAGMGLLVVTLLKLFLHDLWRLGGLYRVVSLVSLAIVLILISFIYQRFLSAESSRPKGNVP